MINRQSHVLGCIGKCHLGFGEWKKVVSKVVTKHKAED